MNFIYNLKDSVTRNKLREMLQTLYPNYKYINVKRDGYIVFKKNWWSLRGEKVSVTKFCLDPELLPHQLSEYARLQYFDSYDSIEIAKFIIVARNNEDFPIIDRLYLEFMRIKYANLWPSYSHELPSSDSIIQSGLKILSRKSKLPYFVESEINSVIKDLKKNLYKNRYLPVTTISQ